MKNTIIAFQGKSRAGKTSTIREFRNTLKKAYSNFKEQIFEEKNDIKTIIEIAYKGKTVKIGIESMGDPYSRLVTEKLKDFISAKCDIIICACRTSGMTVNVINQVASENQYNLIFTSPYISSNNQDALNTLMAQHLLNLVEKQILND